LLLQNLFLELINKDCQKFCDEWNSHLISSAGGHSPNVCHLIIGWFQFTVFT